MKKWHQVLLEGKNTLNEFKPDFYLYKHLSSVKDRMRNMWPLSHRWSEQPWQLLADSRWSWADVEGAVEPEVWAEGTTWRNLCGKYTNTRATLTTSSSLQLSVIWF